MSGSNTSNTSNTGTPSSAADTSSTIVHLLRHGEVYNPERILYGRMSGYGLSDLGREMALVAAQYLADRDITHVVHSPLLRAEQTAEPVAASHRLDPHIDADIIEPTNFFEGKRVSVGDGALSQPKNWWQLRDPFTPSWGEAYVSVARRMMRAVNAAREAAEGSEAVLVSHQLPIWTTRRFIERKPLWHDPRKRECALASVTSIHFKGSAISHIEYADPAAALILKSETAQYSKGA